MERIKKVQNLRKQGKGGSHAYKMATIVALACKNRASSFSEKILGPPKILA